MGSVAGSVGGYRHTLSSLSLGMSRYYFIGKWVIHWTGAENMAPTGIQSSDCQARSDSVYPLCSCFLYML